MYPIIVPFVLTFAFGIGLTPAIATTPITTDADAALALAAAKRTRSPISCVCGSDCPCLSGDCPTKCLVFPKISTPIVPVATPSLGTGSPLTSLRPVGTMLGYEWKNLPGVGWGWVQDGITPRALAPMFPRNDCPNGKCPNR